MATSIGVSLGHKGMSSDEILLRRKNDPAELHRPRPVESTGKHPLRDHHMSMSAPHCSPPIRVTFCVFSFQWMVTTLRPISSLELFPIRPSRQTSLHFYYFPTLFLKGFTESIVPFSPFRVSPYSAWLEPARYSRPVFVSTCHAAYVISRYLDWLYQPNQHSERRVSDSW